MINLIPLGDTYSIYQIADKQEIPNEIISSGFYSVTKTKDETSIVTNCTTEFDFLKSSKNWKGFMVEGVLDFSLTGVINDITKPLKDNGIIVFIISTFNTDYIFTKEEYYKRAIGIFRLTENISIKDNR